MPSAAARRLYEDQIPSFMSVFDLESEMMDDRGLITVVDPKMMDIDPSETKLQRKQPPLHPTGIPADTLHKHHDSTSTQATESADSSPTTTASCTDSSSLSDPSPSSSPDSPVNLIPLSSFPGPTFGGLSSMATLTVSEPTTLERPMTSPSPRRPRNMKGLSIQPPFAASLSSTLVSEPSSPSFIKPKIPAMKRKPSQLSLKTSSNDLIRGSTLEVPASPSVPPILQRRALKHSTSTPHMLSGLKSSTFGPVGGMTIPTVLERNESGLSEFLRPSKPPMQPVGVDSMIPEEGSPIRAQIANRAAFDIEPYHEAENNEDQKSPGYPEGPVAIYGDNVFLYLEPTAEEASKFDVVVNVAREVMNPFEELAKRETEKELAKSDMQRMDDSPIPDTAITMASFTTAFEFPQGDVTPTTPKATLSLKQPEYIHMPWDHNTDIGPDLMSLCETIERKTKEGKKVLVHCQQGASRSASLIIAYGLYQNPELSVNDAYYAAQSKSRWISPNMRLMYCLQDFQKEVSKKRLAPGSGFRPRSGKSPTKHRAALSVDAIDIPPKEPLTAPLLTEDGSSTHSPERSPMRPRGNSTPGREPVSPGPSSAPSSFSWAEKEDEKDRGKFGRFNMDSIFRPSQPDSGFVSSNSLGCESLSRPPPSPGFALPSVLKPPPPTEFAPLSFSKPLASPGLPPPSLSLSRPPPHLGFAPLSLSRPSGSLALEPPSFSKPPPSPGFAARRFGEQSNSNSNSSGGFGFAPLNMSLSAPPPMEKKPTTIEPPIERRIAVMPCTFPDDDALMSPRAETMTSNPLHNQYPDFGGLHFVEVPPTPSDGLFSPRDTLFPRDPFYPFARPTQIADPRSPPTKGETPIVRSIDELL